MRGDPAHGEGNGSRDKKLTACPRRYWAFVLARELGRVDVDAMLDEITPKQFDEWLAALFIGLDVDGWHQAVTVASGLQNELRVLVGSTQHRVPETAEYLAPADYLPASLRKILSPTPRRGS